MRFGKILLAGVLVVVAAGCSGHPASGDQSPSVTRSGSYAPPPSPASQDMQVSARKAAARFSSVYLSRRFAASWDLLYPGAKKHIPRDTWVRVHEGCPEAVASGSGVIKSVTVFGNTAIVTEAITGGTSQPRTIEAVFNYLNRRWGYSPGDLGLYQHGSISADIAAARQAGYCTGQNKPLL